jgi:hypothetical protein
MRAARLVVVFAAVAALVVGPASARVRQPLLRLVGDDVRGTHFVPREVVRVTVTGLETPRHLRLRATARGTVTFAVPAHDPCVDSLVVLVRGATGDDAQLKLPQRMCPMPNGSGSYR